MKSKLKNTGLGAPSLRPAAEKRTASAPKTPAESKKMGGIVDSKDDVNPSAFQIIGVSWPPDSKRTLGKEL